MSADNPINPLAQIPPDAGVAAPRKSSPALGRQIAGATAIVMVSVLLSRLLGFWREWAVAHQVGSNATTDAYYAAFTLPDFLSE